MKRFPIMIFVVSLLWGESFIFAGQKDQADVFYWSPETAYLLPKGRVEFGIFRPAAYGISETLELSTHVLPNILMPNLGVKWGHSSFAGFDMATRHSFYYPTPILRMVAKEGIGGLISPEFKMSHMAALHNEILLSKPFDPRLLMTLKAGLTLAWSSDEPDERSTIDLPLIYPRLDVFYNNYNIRLGVDLQGHMLRRWHYHADSDIFLFPGSDTGLAFEHKGLIIWRKSAHFQLCMGYKVTYADYPFGTQWHMLPLFDLQWARGI